MDELAKTLEIFRGHRVLVTGSTGFKGSWLSTWLAELGAEVVGFALPPAPDAPLFDLLRLKSRIRQHIGDVRNIDEVVAVFQREQPQIVIHLAAQALVPLGYDIPKLTFDTNIGGGVNLLEAVRVTPSVRALVFVTSDKCYLNKEWDFAYRETDELGGRDPYSTSKAAAELVFGCYQSAYFSQRHAFGAASARAGNVIGGGDRSLDRIVPDCIRALEKGEPIRLRNPHATRPWQHVLEPLSGYLLLAARLFSGDQSAVGSWNFALDTEFVRTVEEVARRVADQWGGGEVIVDPHANSRPHEAQLLVLSNYKARRILGWHPRWDFSRAVDQTVAWYREVNTGADPVAVAQRQIEDYVSGT